MPRYFAAPGSTLTDADAAEIGPELTALAEAGKSSPADIVAYAREHDTPIRKHLHLDRPIEEVAEAWYRRRARKVAAGVLVKVRVGGIQRTVRAFHSVLVTTADVERPARRQYVTIRQARDSEAIAGQIISDALDRLRLWSDRYTAYRDVLTAAHPELEAVFEFTELS